MDPRLKKALDAINRTLERVDTATLSAPRDGKWSGAEILEHLALSYQLTTKGMDRCLEMGKPLATRSSWAQRAGALLILDLGYFPHGRKSPARVLPRGMPAEEAVRTIRENLVAMDAAITRAEKRFGKGVKVADHPVLGAFTADQWRRFHLVHAQHHMKQIRALHRETARHISAA